MTTSKPRVAVFFGGAAETRDLSQETGHWVCHYIPRAHYEVTPVHVTADGKWQVPLGGLPQQGSVGRMVDMLQQAVPPLPPRQAMERLFARPVDSIMTVLRGRGGDDGSLHHVAQLFNVPVVGSSAQACQHTAHKHSCQKLVDDIVTSPPSVLYNQRFTPEEMAEEARIQFMPPFFIKPAAAEGSFGVEEVHSADELLPALKRCAKHGDVLLQERAPGKEAMITLTKDESGNTQALPPVMITPRKHTFYDHMAKRRDGRVSLDMADKTTKGLSQAIDTVHMLYEALGCRGLVSFDMMLDGDSPSLLDVNPIPTFTAFTPLQFQLAAARLHPSTLFDRLIRDSLHG